MAENLIIPDTADKAAKYDALLPQIEALTGGETNLIANLANTAAVLKEAFGWLWVGFYFVENDDQLVLGPFQGPIACTRINYGKGVCGTSWKSGETIIVPDVDQFPGHIACSSLSKSEIVVPLKDSMGKIHGVLDIDSADYNQFDEIDQKYLEKVVQVLFS